MQPTTAGPDMREADLGWSTTELVLINRVPTYCGNRAIVLLPCSDPWLEERPGVGCRRNAPGTSGGNPKGTRHLPPGLRLDLCAVLRHHADAQKRHSGADTPEPCKVVNQIASFPSRLWGGILPLQNADLKPAPVSAHAVQPAALPGG